MTADYTIEATPGQVAAIERDGFLVVAGPRVPAEPYLDGDEDGQWVPVPTTKPCPECGGECFIDAVAEADIVHPQATGPEGEPLALCPTCNGDGTVPIVVEVVVPERECLGCSEEGGWGCSRCVGEGRLPARTILRGTAEAVPVEKCSGYTLHICEEVGIWLLHSPLDKPFNDDGLTEVDVTHHFADVPRPEVGDTAWIIRGEGS